MKTSIEFEHLILNAHEYRIHYLKHTGNLVLYQVYRDYDNNIKDKIPLIRNKDYVLMQTELKNKTLSLIKFIVFAYVQVEYINESWKNETVNTR